MKILIGIIVVLGLGWLLLGVGDNGDTSTEPEATEEVVEDGAATAEDEATEDGTDVTPDGTVVSDEEITETEDGEVIDDGEAMEDETPQ